MRTRSHGLARRTESQLTSIPQPDGGRGGIRAQFCLFLVVLCLTPQAIPEYSLTILRNSRVPGTDSFTDRCCDLIVLHALKARPKNRILGGRGNRIRGLFVPNGSGPRRQRAAEQVEEQAFPGCLWRPQEGAATPVCPPAPSKWVKLGLEESTGMINRPRVGPPCFYVWNSRDAFYFPRRLRRSG